MRNMMDRFQIMRQERIQMFADAIEKMKEADLKYFLALMSVLCGIRKKIGMGYLEDLKAVGVIKIENGKIFWIGDAKLKRKMKALIDLGNLGNL